MYWGFPGGADSKESPCNAGDLGSVPGLVRFPGAELQYSCLENSIEKPGGLQPMGSQSQTRLID